MIPALLRQVQDAGHRVFLGEELDLNLIAQRSGVREAGQLDDLLSLVWRERGRWCELAWPCSTDPGRRALAHPEVAGGTAVIEPGQYRRSHQRGLHKGRAALVQVGPIRIRRDDDRDAVVDPSSPPIDGLWGCNIHDDVGIGAEASAGCIVLAREHLTELLDVVQRSERRWGPMISLTLLA